MVENTPERRRLLSPVSFFGIYDIAAAQSDSARKASTRPSWQAVAIR